MINRDTPVKKAYTREVYTKEQIQELIKCKKDPLYFIENYCKVISPSGKEILFKLYPYQKELIDAAESTQYTVALFARQMGKCLFYQETINKNSEEVSIGSLIWDQLTWKEKLITKLEIWKIQLTLWLHKEDVRIARMK